MRYARREAVGRPVIIVLTALAPCPDSRSGAAFDDVLRPLRDRYREDVAFIRVELRLPMSARQDRSPAHDPHPSWAVTTGPWLVALSAAGRLTARWERVAHVEDVCDVLDALLDGADEL